MLELIKEVQLKCMIFYKCTRRFSPFSLRGFHFTLNQFTVGTASDPFLNERHPEVSAVPIHRETEPNPPSNAVLDVDDVHMADSVEPPSVLTGDRELPFTYLSSLLTKWAAMEEDKASNVQGKIKVCLY